MTKEGYLDTLEAVALLLTNRSTFLRAVEKLNIANIKFPNDRKRYFRPEDIERIRREIYKDKVVITDYPKTKAA